MKEKITPQERIENLEKELAELKKQLGISTWNPQYTQPLYETYDPCANCTARLNPMWNGVCHCILGSRRFIY